MPIELRWENDSHTLLYYSITGRWTWEEFLENDDRQRAMLDAIDHQTDIIVDVKGIIIPPDVITHFRRLGQAAGFLHPNRGLIVIIGADNVVRQMLGAFLKIYESPDMRIEMADTYEEAAEKIRLYREKIGDSSAA